MWSQVISPITRHSAVCVWTPLVISTTSIIKSIICAPVQTKEYHFTIQLYHDITLRAINSVIPVYRISSEYQSICKHCKIGSYRIHLLIYSNCTLYLPPIIVRIKEACPGQSTKVYWSRWHVGAASRRWSGMSTENEEKPKSRVMPRSLLWGFLSKLAVLSTVLSALDKLVFPLSTWPSTPTLKLKVAIIYFMTHEPELFNVKKKWWKKVAYHKGGSINFRTGEGKQSFRGEWFVGTQRMQGQSL